MSTSALSALFPLWLSCLAVAALAALAASWRLRQLAGSAGVLPDPSYASLRRMEQAPLAVLPDTPAPAVATASWDPAPPQPEVMVSAADRIAPAPVEAAAATPPAQIRDARLVRLMRLGQVIGFEIDMAARRITLDGRLGADGQIDPTPQQLGWEAFEALVHPADRGALGFQLDAVLAGHALSCSQQLRLHRPDGQWHWLQLRAEAVGDDGADAADAGRPLQHALGHTLDHTLDHVLPGLPRLQGVLQDVQAWQTRGDAAATDMAGAMAFDESAPGHEDTATASLGPVVMLRLRVEDGAVQLQQVSDNVRELWGYTPAHLEHMPDALALLDPAQREAVRAELVEATEQGRPAVALEARVQLADGRYRWVQYRDQYDAQSGERRGHAVDIDERKQAEQVSAQKEQQLQAMVSELRVAQREGQILQETSDMLHSTEDLGEAFEIIRMSAERLFAGWSGWIASAQGSELVVGAHWGDEDHLPPHGFETRDCWGLRRGKMHLYIDASESMCCAHLRHLLPAQRRPYLCVPMAAHGETVGSLHLYTAEIITESELQAVQARASRFAETLKLALSNLKLRASLQERAMRDALTGLFNRRYLDESLPAELQRARRAGTPLAVAMIDVDHFKRFNDDWGHEAGDVVLQGVARLLQGQVRNYDLVCRYGGEEMVIVLPNCGLDDARNRLEHIRGAVAGLALEHKGRQLPPVTVSIGLTDAGPESPDHVLRRADMALYEAKRGGRNRVVSSPRELRPGEPLTLAAG